MKIDLSQTEFSAIFQNYTRSLEEKANLNAALETQRQKVYAVTEEKAILKRQNLELQGTVDGLNVRLERLEKAGRGEPIKPSQEDMTKILHPILAEMAKGNKINAIKLVREQTGLGLKEAKDLVEGTATLRNLVKIVPTGSE